MIRRPQRVQQSFQGLIAAFEFLPLHRQRSVEQNDHGLRRTARAAFPTEPAPLPKPSSASASKNPGSFVLRTGAVSVGEGWPLTGFL